MGSVAKHWWRGELVELPAQDALEVHCEIVVTHGADATAEDRQVLMGSPAPVSRTGRTGRTQWIGQTGTQVPSLSPLVTSPFGPTPMPFGARKPVA